MHSMLNTVAIKILIIHIINNMPINLFEQKPTISKSSTTGNKLFESTPVEEPVKEQNYFQRVGTQYLEAGKNVQKEFLSAVKAPEEGANLAESEMNILKAGINIPHQALRILGEIAGVAFTPITEAPVVKQSLEKLGTGIAAIPGVKELIQNADSLAKKHPEIAKDLQSLVNIAALGGGKAVEAPINKATGTALKKTGTVLKESGAKAAVKETDKFVRDLIRPVQSTAQKEAQVARTTETGFGPFKKSVIAPTPAEKAAEDVVKTIPGISKSKTVQQNYNVIKEAEKKEATKLSELVAKNDFQVPHGESIIRIERASADLANSPLMVGDAEKTAQKLIAGAKRFLDNNAETGSGVLKARKEYDKWVKSQKPKAFDPKSENAFTIANREIRTAMNDVLEERAPNLGIKASLKKQHSMFNAMENLTPKAAQEADSAFMRAVESIGRKLGFKNKAVQAVATIVGIGGLGAASTFAPIIAEAGIPAYLLYKGGKLILKPSLRKAVGNLLKTGGSKLSTSERSLLTGILNDYADNEK